MKQQIINSVRNILKTKASLTFLLDSQYINSDPDDELINSDAHSNNDFQKDVDFGKYQII